MKSFIILPHRFKKLGWIILVPSILLGIFIVSADFEVSWLNAKVFAIIADESFSERRYFTLLETNITSTLVGVLCIAGALLVGFSREKMEDEYIAGIRLSALLWAVGVNYILLLLAFIFIYGMAFMNVMVYNMLTILLLFIGRFNFVLFKNSKSATDEK